MMAMITEYRHRRPRPTNMRGIQGLLQSIYIEIKVSEFIAGGTPTTSSIDDLVGSSSIRISLFGSPQ